MMDVSKGSVIMMVCFCVHSPHVHRRGCVELARGPGKISVPSPDSLGKETPSQSLGCNCVSAEALA